jgi:hypothetical protein
VRLAGKRPLQETEKADPLWLWISEKRPLRPQQRLAYHPALLPEVIFGLLKSPYPIPTHSIKLFGTEADALTALSDACLAFAHQEGRP